MRHGIKRGRVRLSPDTAVISKYNESSFQSEALFAPLFFSPSILRRSLAPKALPAPLFYLAPAFSLAFFALRATSRAVHFTAFFSPSSPFHAPPAFCCLQPCSAVIARLLPRLLFALRHTRLCFASSLHRARAISAVFSPFSASLSHSAPLSFATKASRKFHIFSSAKILKIY